MSRPNSSKRMKMQRTRMYNEQRGLCFWCSRKCVLPESLSREELNKPPQHLATTDHLDDRFSPLRGTMPGQVRHVMACRKCNAQRSKESMLANQEEHRRRSEAGHVLNYQKKLLNGFPEESPMPIEPTIIAEQA